MATMTVSLPDSMKEWIDEQVEAGEIESSGDYLRDLVVRDRERRDEERIEALRRIVEEALASGVSTRTTNEIFAEAVEIARRAAPIVSSYRLTARANNDLLDIYLFGIEQFGFRQAERYKASLDNCFSILAGYSRMGRSAATLGSGVRRHEHGSHVILYREGEDHILILAVVHGRSVRGLKL